ncbi:bifunctional diguanylate cyclase/phosphodiesterase [Fundidesulfovibrio butyratiphilus]
MNKNPDSSTIIFKNLFEQGRGAATRSNGNAKPKIATFFDPLSCPLDKPLGVITLQLADFHLNFSGMGMETGLQCLDICLELALETFETHFPGCAVVLAQEAMPGEFVLLFTHPGRERIGLFGAYLALRADLSKALGAKLPLLSGAAMELLVGFAEVDNDGPDPAGKPLHTAVCRARRLSLRAFDQELAKTSPQFKSILEQGFTGVLFQPVVNLTDGAILGWEALARSGSGFSIQEALNLLELKGAPHEALEFERSLWRLALSGCGPLAAHQKLHLNVSPACLADHAYHPGEFAKLAADFGVAAHQIVLEFSEKLSPGELSGLLERLEVYKSYGFLTAIDDIGAGNSNLLLLARFRPDYIKADVSLIRDIESNPFKRVMIETLVLMAEKTGAQVVAEGVETELALSSLVSMGVHAGQGHYLAAPAFPKPDRSVRIPLKASYKQAMAGEWKCSSPVGELAGTCPTVECADVVQDVKRLLADKPPMSSVVVAEGERPVGLIMNYNLDRLLSRKYGVDLYYKKSVAKLMDSAPLVVEHSTPIEDAARMAMNRGPDKIYDDIIITRGGALSGAVSVQKILDTLAKVQVELAKGSNPLTGLPGNVSIEQEFQRRSRESIASSLIYIDLDNFKVYNDVYGFNQGDKAILLTAQLTREAVRQAGLPQDFIGHVGGDDFLLITAKSRADAICQALVESFSREAPKLYREEHRRKGCIVGKNREGVEQCFPLMTMSVGILDCDFQTPVSYADLSQRTAEVKKFAKSKPGNSVARDRRAPLGSPSSAAGCDSRRTD